MRATQAIIHLDHLKHNINEVRKILDPLMNMCMAVKADAYGHGAVEISKTALQSGVDCLGVATIQEGIILREAGITCPVILFSLPLPEEIPSLFYYHIIPIVASRDFVTLLEQEGKQDDFVLEVHLKIDTGMGRIGCQPGEAVDIARAIDQSSYLKLNGVCTHFAGSDMKENQFAMEQARIFNEAIDDIKAAGLHPGIIHAANSGAVIDMPGVAFDMVRPGILLYGYYPSNEQARSLDVKPIMELKTKITFIKKVPPQTPISYGMTYRTTETTHIATIPIGYGDGYSRLLSNKGNVYIKGKQYPIVGRVCMDQCMINLGPTTDVNIYDEVILFGPDPGTPNAEDIAGLMETIPYEVTCLITKRVPRVYV